jgi:hypothetical protein
MDVRKKAAEGSLARFPEGVVTDNWRFRVDEPQGEARSFRRSLWLIAWRRLGLFEKSRAGRTLAKRVWIGRKAGGGAEAHSKAETDLGRECSRKQRVVQANPVERRRAALLTLWQRAAG